MGASAYSQEDAWHYLGLLDEARRAAGRSDDPFAIFLALKEPPDRDLYRRFEDAGVTDMLCAPWMLAAMSTSRDYESPLDAKLAATEEFATNVIAKMS